MNYCNNQSHLIQTWFCYLQYCNPSCTVLSIILHSCLTPDNSDCNFTRTGRRAQGSGPNTAGSTLRAARNTKLPANPIFNSRILFHVRARRFRRSCLPQLSYDVCRVADYCCWPCGLLRGYCLRLPSASWWSRAERQQEMLILTTTTSRAEWQHRAQFRKEPSLPRVMPTLSLWL